MSATFYVIEYGAPGFRRFTRTYATVRVARRVMRDFAADAPTLFRCVGLEMTPCEVLP